MSRPKSMPDFSVLMDASTPLFEARAQNRRQTSPVRGQGHPRKKLSISLAAGLIMNNDTPKSTGRATSPERLKRLSLHSTREEELEFKEKSDSLFYAYALKSDYSNSPPYTLTFASAAVCARWWALVQREYPDSSRPGAQLFVLTSESLDGMKDNLRFYNLKNRWFYTGEDNLSNTTAVIPLQNEQGHAIASVAPAAPAPETSSENFASLAIETLTDSVARLASIVEGNTEQIHALSVAQSAGLQRMQEINEATSTQIKALADSQSKLQALIDQNASHYVALSNASFSTQEQMKSIMKSTTTQIQGLSKNQAQLANTCDSMMRGIESLATSVAEMNISSGMSDAGSSISTPPFGSLSTRISPPPRKLNRKIKGVWYEYDAAVTPNASPRRSVAFVDTPPKRPVINKKP